MPYQADSSQAAIKQALLAAGCSVALIEGANHARGIPDMVVGRDGRNYLLECKTPKAKGRSAGKLSPEQAEWHCCWRGQVAVVLTPEDALRAVEVLR